MAVTVILSSSTSINPIRRLRLYHPLVPRTAATDLILAGTAALRSPLFANTVIDPLGSATNPSSSCSYIITAPILLLPSIYAHLNPIPLVPLSTTTRISSLTAIVRGCCRQTPPPPTALIKPTQPSGDPAQTLLFTGQSEQINSFEGSLEGYHRISYGRPLISPVLRKPSSGKFKVPMSQLASGR